MSNEKNIQLSTPEELLKLLEDNKDAQLIINVEHNSNLIAIPSCEVVIKNQLPYILQKVAIQSILPQNIITELRQKEQKHLIPYTAFRDQADNIKSFLKRDVRVNLMNGGVKTSFYKESHFKKK